MSTGPITRTFLDTVAERVDGIAFRFHDGHDIKTEAWNTISWVQYGTLVDQLAATLVDRGIQPGDRVAILSANRWEWQVADLAVLMTGAVSVPVYPTSSPAQVAYIVEHSGARVCFAESVQQLNKLRSSEDQLPELSEVMLFGTPPVPDDDSQPAADGQMVVTGWDDALAHGAALLADQPLLARSRSERVQAGNLATIVYTSGTTGPPKGVLLTHANISAAVDMIRQVVPIGPEDRFLSFLPLSHIAERVVSHFGHLACGGETWFARSLSTLAEDLTSCRPTVFFAVPRVWEKVRAALELETAKSHGIQRWMLDRYRALSLAHVDGTEPEGGVLHRMADLERIALDRVVGAKIRHGLGLDRARALFSGAAAIDPALLRWLGGVGLTVGEVYGQTEVCGPTTISQPGHVHIGSVGPALPGLQLSFAADSEILVRGPSVCAGYFRNPDATASLIDADGWMHSGDLGHCDADGHLHISGRKKDLMKTAGGKYIAPQELELRLGSCRFIANAVVVAEGRPYVTALLTLDAEAVGPWAVHHGKPASLEALAADPDVLAEVAKQVEAVNQDMSHAEQVKRWRLLPRDLTLDAGEMTPTLKVVRPVVMQHFADAVDRLYA